MSYEPSEEQWERFMRWMVSRGPSAAEQAKTLKAANDRLSDAMLRDWIVDNEARWTLTPQGFVRKR